MYGPSRITTVTIVTVTVATTIITIKHRMIPTRVKIRYVTMQRRVIDAIPTTRAIGVHMIVPVTRLGVSTDV